ncbi:uncharacterized protein LOC127497747 isoform X2 [Ctenopharyngodon idella]|uniref:uncharacterized protein LOC127497747 isoform X2 n=1 Tax=Ctenopharyngodon idella TaxID=7959 RepID=UPI00222E1878|nr:uncharacterized protein LOC127497747 isoform X2 [Ctenopharyngodon idella]
MMGSFQLSYFQILYILISALLYFKAQTERPCKQVYQLDINYVQGDYMSISCLTTTHPLESLTVKLRRTNPVKDILICSDTSPVSEHQRWSVRNDAGNVTLYLKDISLSDDGLYDCQVYNGLDCLKATRFNLSVIKCKILNPVYATAYTSVLLPCSEHSLQNRPDRVTWKIVTGQQSTEITQYRPPHKPSNSKERVPRPLYERARILGNGSLLIRDAVNTDGSWYKCRVNETTCYEVKLVMKDYGTSQSTTKLETLSTTCPTCHTVATQRPCKQVHQLNINYVEGDNMSISYLTTTHPLESLTVKLRRTDPVQHILIYSDTSPASEHQRWSLRNYSGSVTLYLKDISLSDQGRYEYEVYKDWDCLNATLLNLRVRECKTLDFVHATPDSSVLLPCSEHPVQNRTDQVTWKIFHGHQSTEITQYRPPNKPLNSTERDPRPLYERARIIGNGSLLIRDAVNTDGSWYQCRVSEKTCYEVKLVMKVITDAPTPADSPAEVTANLIAVLMVTIVYLGAFITLIICVTLYFKKGRSKINNQIELDCWSSVSYSEISGGFDVPFNSLVL